MKRVLLLIVMASFVLAMDCTTLENHKSEIVGTNLPEYIPYQDEVFNIHMQGETMGHVVLDNGTVTSFSCDQSDSPTYNVHIQSPDVIETIASSDNPLKTLNGMLGSEIEVKGTTVGKKVKGFFTRLALSIGAWFS
ncbi:MAG: hypothetical protein ACQESG_04405 [Nanobdellota archaeon]